MGVTNIYAQSDYDSPLGEWTLTTETTIGKRAQTIWITRSDKGWLLKNNDVEIPIQLESNAINWELVLDSDQGNLSISARGEQDENGEYRGKTITSSKLFGSREASWILTRKTKSIAEN